MLLIAAALAEELDIALDLCRSRSILGAGNVRIRTGTFQGQAIYFLKTGVGPVRAGRNLDAVLSEFHPRRILIIGYAGALSPGMNLGDLVVMRRTSIFGEDEAKHRPLEQMEISASYELDGSSELYHLAQTAGLTAHRGEGLTSHFIIGDPRQKQILHRRFGALSIDMETAALARSAGAVRIPLSCVRAVSDNANDEFLAPFSYDPGVSPFDRAIRVLAAGNWLNRFHSWRERAATARESLRSLLNHCFEVWAKGGGDDSWLQEC